MTDSQDEIVTLYGQATDGSALEIEMPRWAHDAVHRGDPVVYRGEGDWEILVDDDGRITKRMPLAAGS